MAMVAVPQAMAYAAIAGVNPVYGLYTAVIPAIVGALLTSSNHLITGPTNAIALVTAEVLLPVAGRTDYIEFVFALAILSGLIMLLLGVLKLGGLIHYVSNSVLTGFLAGASVLIVVNQLGNLLGLERPAGERALGVVWFTTSHLHEANPYAFATGLFAVAVLLVGRRIHSKLPVALLALVLAGALVQVAGWDAHGVRLVDDMGSLSGASLLAFHVPDIPSHDLQTILPSAGAVALLALVESLSVAKAIGLSTNQRVEASRECIAQGMACMVGGIFRCIPSAGSLSRSAVNYDSGAKTHNAGAFSGLFVLLAMLIFSRLIAYVPIPSLAGVVVVSAYHIVDYHHLKLTWQSRAVSRVVLIVTFIATLLLPLHIAIYLGALLSIGIYLYESSNVRLSYLTLNDSGQFVEHSLEDVLRDRPSIAVINVEGALYFGAVAALERHLSRVLEAGVEVVILRLRRMRLLASTGVTALEGLVRRANQQGVTLLVCGVTDDVAATLGASEINALFGDERTFGATEVLFESTRQALEHARQAATRTSASV